MDTGFQWRTAHDDEIEEGTISVRVGAKKAEALPLFRIIQAVKQVATATRNFIDRGGVCVCAPRSTGHKPAATCCLRAEGFRRMVHEAIINQTCNCAASRKTQTRAESSAAAAASAAAPTPAPAAAATSIGREQCVCVRLSRWPSNRKVLQHL